MKSSTVVSKWGNSKGIRVPAEVLKAAKIDVNDRLFFEVDENDRVILTKVPTPKKGTLEYLFRDYDGGSFRTKLLDLGEPVGDEQW